MTEPLQLIVRRVAEQHLSRYATEYHADHLSWEDFADDAAADVATALDVLSTHIYVAGRAALTAKDNQLWEIRNAGADSWIGDLAEATRKGAWKR